jgi:capsular polysaccharide biosynthesis protein
MAASMEVNLPINLDADFEPVLRQRRAEFSSHLPVVRYRRCFVTHSGIGLKHLRPIKESLYPNLPRRLRLHFHRRALEAYLGEPRVTFSEPALLLLHNHWSGGYHHWIAECLVKLKEIDPRRFVAVLPSDYSPFAIESLRMFPLAGIAQLPAGQALGATWLTVVGNPHVSRFNPVHIRWLREYLWTHIGARGSGTERLYVTRRNALWRQVENEDEVIDVLRRYGFTCVDSAELSFRDEVRLFSECQALVSLHGAGLTNCVFMPPGGHVLELYRAFRSRTGSMNTTYWHLCSAAGMNYYYQFCQPGSNHGHTSNDANVSVDRALLERNVRMMLEA